MKQKMVAPVQQVYRYRLDAEDVIDFVDSWWLAFAKENSAAELNETSVLGHSIWEFIADEATQKLYREIHQHVRSTGKSIEVPFRCDSPTLQRYMQLTIRRESEGQLLYESMLIRAKPQHRLAVLDARLDRSDAVLTMCSFCKRSLVEPSGWLEMENISLKLRTYDEQTVPKLRYTVCPECSRQVSDN